MKTTVRAGSKVLLVYPAGDCDWVEVINLWHFSATVRLPDGRVQAVPVEDIGIGVDDDIIGITDSGEVIS